MNAPPTHSHRRVSPPPESKPLSILTIEDNPADSALVQGYLTQSRRFLFSNRVAPTLSDAVEMASTATFDLAIVDLDLPDSHGVGTIESLRQASPDLPILVYSGAVDDELREAAIAAGAQDVVDKSEMSQRLFATTILYVVEHSRARLQRKQIQTILDSSLDALVVVDAPGHVRYVNEAAANLFGKEKDFLEGLDVVFSAREGAAVELSIPRADSPRIGELRVIPLDTRSSWPSLAQIRDVTEQKALEMQLLISDRMATIGTLVAGVAHEINSPLAAVAINIEMLERELRTTLADGGADGGDPGRLLEMLDDARDGARRVQRIVKDLKVFSHPAAKELTSVDVRQVLHSALRLVQHEIRHRAKVSKHLDDVPPVHADATRLGQVLINILINAAQAMDCNASHNEIRINASFKAPGHVLISISDTGAGMSPEVQKRLFTPFFTTKPVGEGTGLGLAMCHRIISEFQGTISFTSEVGRGTCFELLLPVSSDVETPPSTSVTPPAVPRSRKARILVIDDSEPIVLAIERILSLNHDVVALSSSEEGLERLLAGEQFDLILCDLMMPQVSGRELYARVREQDPCIAERFAFVSGGAVGEAERDFLQSTTNRFLEKPFSSQQLEQLVAQVLSEQPA